MEMSKSPEHEPDEELVRAIDEFFARMREKGVSPGHESAVTAIVKDVADRLCIPVPTVDGEETLETQAAGFYGQSAARLWAFQAACGLLSQAERDHLLDLLLKLNMVAEDWKLPRARHIEAAHTEFMRLFRWLLCDASDPPEPR